MTIAELIDYLNQFPGTTRVVLFETDADASQPYVVLDLLDFTDYNDKEIA
jgi:hypothetical protein